MKQRILRTNTNWEPLLGRLLLGSVIFAHGAQKLLGWFGGYGYSKTMNFFIKQVELPWLLALFIILLESVGAILLILGIGTRILAFLFTLLAIGIVITSHWEFGFFMNWFGQQGGEGYEYFLLWMAISISLVISGGGKYSVDGYWVG